MAEGWQFISAAPHGDGSLSLVFRIGSRELVKRVPQSSAARVVADQCGVLRDAAGRLVCRALGRYATGTAEASLESAKAVLSGGQEQQQ